MLPLPQARVAVVTLRLALDRLVRVAFAGLLPAPNRAERSDRVTLYHPAGDLPLQCDSAQELCAPNQIGVAVTAEPADLSA